MTKEALDIKRDVYIQHYGNYYIQYMYKDIIIVMIITVILIVIIIQWFYTIYICGSLCVLQKPES